MCVSRPARGPHPGRAGPADPPPGAAAPEAGAKEPEHSKAGNPGSPAETKPAPDKPAAETRPAETGREEIVGLQKLGGRLTERGDWDAAEIAYRQIMASHKATEEDLANALLGLARVFRRQGSLTKADCHFATLRAIVFVQIKSQ